MTNGSSQGLFVLIAVIIFGIFIFMSYLLFRDTLKPSLAHVFDDGLSQASCSISGGDDTSIECNPTFNNSFEVTGYFNMAFLDTNTQGATSYPYIWTAKDHSVRTINLKNYIDNGSSLNIDENYVEVYSIQDNAVHIKEDFLQNGFGKDITRKAYISINNEDETYAGSSDISNVSWGRGKGLKLKIGEINTIKITYENIYGGKTIYTIQVNIINE